MHHSWKLPSNSGWNMTSWGLRDVVRINRRLYLVVEVVLTGRYWDRVKLSRWESNRLELVKEYSVVLPQVLLSEARMKSLYRELRKWLKTPITKFIDTPLTLIEELGGTDAQRFSIEFGMREEFATEIGHMVCTILYKGNAFSGEYTYVVDQSCVQTFVDGLGGYFLRPREDNKRLQRTPA